MIRGILVGAGQVALTGHIPAYVQDSFLSREVKIVAVVDECVENLHACESRLPGIRGYRNVEDAFANEDAHFVDICTPPHVRLDVIRQAVSRGWHTLCEKPLAIDLRAALEIRELLDHQHIVFLPCHQYPFSPLWRTVLEQLQEGAIGDVRLASMEAYREHADPGSCHWRAGWRQRREIAGGGILMDIGTHYFHMAHLMFGTPTAVTARTARLGGGEHDVEDTAVVVLDYPARLVEVRLSWAAHRRENRLHLVGSAGSLTSDGTMLRLDCGERHHLWTFPDAMSKSAYPVWYAELFKEFFRAIFERHVSSQALENAISTLRLVEAAYASASCNKAIWLAGVNDAVSMLSVNQHAKISDRSMPDLASSL